MRTVNLQTCGAAGTDSGSVIDATLALLGPVAPSAIRASLALVDGHPVARALNVTGSKRAHVDDRCDMGTEVSLAALIHALRAAPGTPKLVIDIPPVTRVHDRAASAELIAAGARVLQSENFVERTVVCSLDWTVLRRMREYVPGVQIWFITYPLSWYRLGVPIMLGNTELTQEALTSWLPTSDISSLSSALPAEVVSFSASGWVLSQEDIDSQVLETAGNWNLKLHAYSLGTLSPADCMRLLSSGCDGYIISEPSSTDMTDLIAAAQSACDKKRWNEVLQLCQILLAERSETVPAATYRMCATALRSTQRRDECEQMLRAGITRFADNRELQVESVVLSMARNEWSHSLQQWERLSDSNRSSLSSVNYTRYAKCAEMVGNLTTYRSVLAEGLHAHPNDVELLWRSQHAVALGEIERKDWASALSRLELLRAVDRLKAWPVATEFHQMQCRMGLALSEAHSAEESLKILEKMIERADRLRCCPQDVAGIAELLRIQASIRQERSLSILALESAIQGVAAQVAQLRSPLSDTKTSPLLVAIAQLASVIHEHEFEDLLLPKDAWLTLANLMIVGAHLDCYNIARKKALATVGYATEEVLAHIDSAPVEVLRDQIRFAVERHDEKLFRRILEAHRKADMSLQRRDAAIFRCSALYFSPKIRESAASLFDDPKIDETRANCLSGKSIAIVGPANDGLRNGEEIDSFDLVLRFNYRGLHGFDPSRFGSRTDLSFYIDLDLPKTTVNRSLVRHMDGLKLLFLDRASSFKIPTIMASRTPAVVRYPAGDEYTNPFFKGTANAVQRSLFDVLRYPIKRVKVFNANLFFDTSTAAAYRKYKPGGYVDAYNFCRHDPICNFLFLKRTWEAGVIEADELLSSVLRKSSDEYMEGLSMRYGTPRPKLDC